MVDSVNNAPVDAALIVTVASKYKTDPSLVHAVVAAEGGTARAIVKAVQCSEPHVTTIEDALGVVCRSANHAAFNFLHARGLGADYVRFFGATWAPVGVANDPTNLNANWAANVLSHWQP